MATEAKSALPHRNRDFLEATVVRHLATARRDGELQSSPVWRDERVIVYLRPTGASSMAA